MLRLDFNLRLSSGCISAESSFSKGSRSVVEGLKNLLEFVHLVQSACILLGPSDCLMRVAIELDNVVARVVIVQVGVPRSEPVYKVDVVDDVVHVVVMGSFVHETLKSTTVTSRSVATCAISESVMVMTSSVVGINFCTIYHSGEIGSSSGTASSTASTMA